MFREMLRSLKSSMTPADSNLVKYYQILQIQSSPPDDGRKHRPKHVELTGNDKLTCIFEYLLVTFIIMSQFTDSWPSKPSSTSGILWKIISHVIYYRVSRSIWDFEGNSRFSPFLLFWHDRVHYDTSVWGRIVKWRVTELFIKRTCCPQGVATRQSVVCY
jgi:hypothetical protein